MSDASDGAMSMSGNYNMSCIERLYLNVAGWQYHVFDVSLRRGP
jgi:hypothetical protein